VTSCFLSPDGGYQNLRPSVLLKAPDGNTNITSRVIISLLSATWPMVPRCDVIPPTQQETPLQRNYVCISANFRRGKDSHGACDDAGPPQNSQCASTKFFMLHTTFGTGKLNTAGSPVIVTNSSVQMLAPATVLLSMASVQARGGGGCPDATKSHIPKYTLHCQKLHVFSNALTPTRLRQRATRPRNTHAQTGHKNQPLCRFREIRRKLAHLTPTSHKALLVFETYEHYSKVLQVRHKSVNTPLSHERLVVRTWLAVYSGWG
jgi:hypothetical protein